MARLLLALAVALVAAAAPAPATAAERPIVYVLVLDGFDGDRFDAGAAPFLTSLVGSSGTYYAESRSIMIAETNPNHTAMMTGAYGDRSGIPGNAFALYAPLENEDSCKATGPENLGALPTPTSGENANCVLAETLFAAIRRQGNAEDLRTAAVFGKPKLGRIFAGKQAEGPWERDVDHIWAPCASGADDDAYCGEVPTNPISGYAVDDAAVMDEVLRTVREGVGSPARRPDLTFVNLHQIDSAGHATGTSSGAYDAAIAMADDQVRRLVDELQARGEWDRTVLIIQSDHSMDTTLTKTTLTPTLAASVPESDFLIVQNYSVNAIYVKRADAGRFATLKKLRAAALSNPNVTEALYREENPEDGGAANTIGTRHPGWRATGARSADLFVVHRPGGAFADPDLSANPLPGNHGAPHTRDNLYAIAGGGGLVRRAVVSSTAAADFDDTLQNPGQAENVDTAPTVAALLGLLEPRDNAGRALLEAFDLARVPGGGRPAARATLRVRALRRGRLRIDVGPAGGRYDVRVRSAGSRGWRRVARDAGARRFTFRGRRGRRYQVEARLRAAAGVPGPFTRRTARAR